MVRLSGSWASLALAAATSASAMLVPSTVSLDNLINSRVGTTSLDDPHRQLLKVPCLDCPYAQPLEGGEGYIWTDGVENALVLDISVGSDPTTLLLNGVQFYPPLLSPTTVRPYIVQVPASISFVDLRENPSLYGTQPLRLTSWSFAAGSSRTTETGDELLTIAIVLLSLEEQEVNVPEITLTALKDTEGKLVILRADAIVPEGAPTDGPEKECTGWPLLCKWRAILANRLEALRSHFHFRPHGCGKGMKPGDKRPSIFDGVEDNDGNLIPAHDEEHGPGHKKPHGHHGNHHKHHGHHKSGWHKHHHKHHHKHYRVYRILHAVGRVMLTVFVPLLVGVGAGMLVYLAGYIVGATVMFVMANVLGYRRGGDYQAVALEEGDDEAPVSRSSIDKALYVALPEEHGEAPPQYVEVEANEVEKKQ